MCIFYPFMSRFILVLVSLLSLAASAEVRISEVMQCNQNTVIDDRNEFPDSWVELHNNGTSDVCLRGYAIGEKRIFEKAYALPNVTVPAGGYLLLYCDKVAEGLHTNFRIGVHKEGNLYLFGPDGMFADSIRIPPMLGPDISFGRNGHGEAGFFPLPTPATGNVEMVTDKIAPKPVFSVCGGVFASPFSLVLEAEGEIRYTTNGEEPTIASELYTHPLPINSNTVVRAKVFVKGMAPSNTVTHSYLFLKRQQTLPVVSLVTNPDNLYGDEHGILVKGTYGENHPGAKPKVSMYGVANYFFGWKRPANMEYFPQQGGGAAINQVCELNVGGNASRRRPVKTFVVDANKRFGEKSLSYPFFPDKEWQHENRTVMLRNSGQDYASTFLRDAFMQRSFARHTSIDYQACQPAIVFVNGEYAGLRNIRERVNEDYLEANNVEKADLIEGFGGKVKKGNGDAFAQFKKAYADSSSTYGQLSALIDVDEFLDYLVLNSLYCNTDFPANNVMMWRKRQPEGKWRWIAKDMDFGMGLLNSPYDFNYLNFLLRKEPYRKMTSNTEGACKLFQKMMSFPQFRQAYIDRVAVYMGTFASADSLTALLDTMAAAVAYEIPFFTQRGTDEDEWKKAVSDAKKWICNRVPFFYTDVARFFNLGRAVPLEVRCSGGLYMNGIPLCGNAFCGKFFEGRLFMLSAECVEGFDADLFQLWGETSGYVAKTVSRVDGCWRENEFVLPQGTADANWVAQYVKGDSLYTELYADELLVWRAPVGASSVRITQKGQRVEPAKVVAQSNLMFDVVDFSGRKQASGPYNEVMPRLEPNRNYIITTFKNGKKVCSRKVRRVEP